MENTNSQAQPKPKRVLWLSDFACSTGFATVAQNIMVELLKSQKYQIDVIGINYHGIPSEWQNFYPQLRLLPATIISNGDLFGRLGLLNLLTSGVYDILFTLQDTFILETIGEKILEIRSALIANGKKPFKWIFYFPIDAKPKENWIRKAPFLADYPVAYTKYGYDQVIETVPEIKFKLRHIPHGFDPKQFSPIPDDLKKKFKQQFFINRADNKFVITNVNRNQPRKDVARTMQIFKYFKQQVPDSILYLHMKDQDVAYTISEIARNFDLIKDQDFIVPKDFDEHDGVSVEILNAIYNVSDVVMTTSLGEGWGLSMTEAMATKTPVIAPNHTSLTEMLSDDRGTLVSAGKRLTDWIAIAGDNERLRPVADVAEYVDKLVAIKHHYSDYKAKAEKAYKFVTENLTWEIVCKQWLALFEEASTIKKKVEIGRNDPCYCGSGKKYKHCHLPYDR